MSDWTIWHWLFALLVIGNVALAGIVARRAGFSAWWALALFVPVANIIILWLFAYAKWPALQGRYR